MSQQVSIERDQRPVSSEVARYRTLEDALDQFVPALVLRNTYGISINDFRSLEATMLGEVEDAKIIQRIKIADKEYDAVPLAYIGLTAKLKDTCSLAPGYSKKSLGEFYTYVKKAQMTLASLSRITERDRSLDPIYYRSAKEKVLFPKKLQDYDLKELIDFYDKLEQDILVTSAVIRESYRIRKCLSKSNANYVTTLSIHNIFDSELIRFMNKERKLKHLPKRLQRSTSLEADLGENVAWYFKCMSNFPMLTRDEQLQRSEEIQNVRNELRDLIYQSYRGAGIVLAALETVINGTKSAAYNPNIVPAISITRSRYNLAKNAFDVLSRRKRLFNSDLRIDMCKALRILPIKSQLILNTVVNQISIATNGDPQDEYFYVAGIKAMHAHYLELRRGITEPNLRLVVSIAKKYIRSPLPFIDLITHGNAGLIRAVDDYDVATGNQFSTYATLWIRQAVKRAVDSESRLIRRPAHVGVEFLEFEQDLDELTKQLCRNPTDDEIMKHLGIDNERLDVIRTNSSYIQSVDPFDDDGDSLPIPDPGLENRIDELSRAEQIEIGIQLVEKLNRKQKFVTLLRYGWQQGELTRRLERIALEDFNVDINISDSTSYFLQDIARIIGITREGVRQIEIAAQRNLRKALVEKYSEFDEEEE